MTTVGKWALWLGLVIVSLSAAARGAEAAGGYGSFVIRNPNSVAIKYQVRWGDGEWTRYEIPPGYMKWHYWPLDSNGHVPTPSVRFDCIGGDDGVTMQTYRMSVLPTPDPQYGRRYVFRYTGGRFLDLYTN